MNQTIIELESKIIEEFRKDNVNSNTIHFLWDRVPITPADYILKVITRNVWNGQMFVLKTVLGDTHVNCMHTMLDYLKKSHRQDSIWIVDWKDKDGEVWESYFRGKDREEVEDKLSFDTENLTIEKITEVE